MLPSFITRCALVAVAGLSVLAVSAGLRGAGAEDAAGFFTEQVAGDIPQATDFAFAPDGRIFVASRTGEVFVYEDGELATTFIELPDVNTHYYRGLIGLALDPAFDTNGYVYLYYVHNVDPAHPGGRTTARLIRVTADGDQAIAGSGVVLLGGETGDATEHSCHNLPAGSDCIPADGGDHFGGALRFGTDGMLYLSTGDGFVYLNDVQDVNRLAGKLLRLNADGSGPSDNPFFTGDPRANASKVFAYGFRNPFRLGFQPDTGVPIVGDVGSFYWEELNAVQPGSNYGWPCYEGLIRQPSSSGSAFCQAMYNSGDPTAHPAHLYRNPVLTGGAAIVAGVFYQGSTYPPEADGAFFYADFPKKWIKTLQTDQHGNLLPESDQVIFEDAGASPVDFEIGPEGDVYFLAMDPNTGISEVRHIRYVPGNRPPVARGLAAPRGGLAPLAVSFDSSGSLDPDGDTLSFEWDFADGASSTDGHPAHTFETNGVHPVELTVSDSVGASSGVVVPIVVGNRPPRAWITSPISGTGFVSGAKTVLRGRATDAEDGTLSGLSLAWQVILYHCDPASGGCHTHLIQTGRGEELSIVAPHEAPGETFFLQAVLTATDSTGLTATALVVIGPDADGDGVPDDQDRCPGVPDPVAGVSGEGQDDTCASQGQGQDSDGDGCLDTQELGPVAGLGGQRNPSNFWDFYDTPNRDNVRDGRISLAGDILSVVLRFGANDARGAALINRYSDPLSTPPLDIRAYHPAFDRSPAAPGVGLWDLGPPDGTIVMMDVVNVILQYGHTC